jgi:predicted ATPase/DNA-binding SARP family transcriptional activator/tetratricopeptide (TPR) repeat protein
MLGPLTLRDGADREIEVGGARLRMLLVRLALDAGRIVPNESLIDGLWGEQPPSDATNALQSLVSRLRRAGVARALESHPVGYSLMADDVDVHTFERLAAEGGQLLRYGQATEAAAVLREALDLWRGPALVDVADAPFATPTIARLAELRLTALEDRIEADIRRGRDADVIVELSALAREHPLRERVAVLLVKALHRAGRQADALKAYDTAKNALADELGMDPGQELRDTHLAVLRSAPADVPRNGSTLPAQLTSFVGRHNELTELGKVLAADRLVTLVGPGGAGKTRLATEAATRAAERVWFVHLAGLRESVDVPIALSAALGLADPRVTEPPAMWGARADVMSRLIEALKDRADLVVLDNCEHLITAAAHLADALLTGCPRLRILATSREPLAITGETLLPVGPLDLPDVNAPIEQAVERAAVRLFLDRASAVRPGFHIDDHNAESVVSICRQLDGLPLALELAAARLRSMTVGQVAERLHDRFRLLSGGSRTSLPRHQTLGAVVEWSWSLLADPERTLATRLSVFASPATLDAVTAVCAGGDLPQADVLYVLASLVEKSLVEALEGTDGQPRYRMLQTVRAFVAERLADPGEVRAKFAAYMLELVEDLDPKLRGPHQVEALSMFDAEQGNVIAAVRTAVETQDGATSCRIAAAWTWYWMLRQGVFSGDTLSEHAMPVDRMVPLEAGAPSDARVMLRILALVAETDGEAALGQIKELIQLTGVAVNESRYPLLALIEPGAYMLVGEEEKAAIAFRRSLRHPDSWARAVAAVAGALAAENAGQIDRAERWFTHAIRACRRIGDRWGLTMALSGLAGIRSIRGDVAGAIERFEESARLEIEFGLQPEPPMVASRLAEQRYRAGDPEGALRDLERALVVSQERSQQAVAVLIRCKLSAVARTTGDLTRAWQYIEDSRTHLVRRPDGSGDPMPAWLDTAELALLVAEGRFADARATGREALAGAQRGFIVDYQSVAAVGEGLATLAAAEGDLTGAARLLGASHAVRGATDLGSPDVRALLARFGEAEHEVFEENKTSARERALEILAAGASVPPETEAPPSGQAKRRR